MPRHIALVEIDNVICVAETAKAIKVFIDGNEFWVPQSLVDEDSEVYKIGDEGTLVIPEWFAIKEGLAEEVE